MNWRCGGRRLDFLAMPTERFTMDVGRQVQPGLGAGCGARWAGLAHGEEPEKQRGRSWTKAAPSPVVFGDEIRFSATAVVVVGLSAIWFRDRQGSLASSIDAAGSRLADMREVPQRHRSRYAVPVPVPPPPGEASPPRPNTPGWSGDRRSRARNTPRRRGVAGGSRSRSGQPKRGHLFKAISAKWQVIEWFCR